MTYKYIYKTSENFSDMVMNSDGENLTGLWFEGSKDTAKHVMDCEEKDLEIFRETKKWLDIYFSGQKPDFLPKYKIDNLTPFRQDVIDIMNTIEYGKVVTYNDISKIIAKKRGWNPICIIIPCHRVVGTNGSLTGYGGGIKNKVELLKLEGIDMNKYFIPKSGTAL